MWVATEESSPFQLFLEIFIELIYILYHLISSERLHINGPFVWDTERIQRSSSCVSFLSVIYVDTICPSQPLADHPIAI